MITKVNHESNEKREELQEKIERQLKGRSYAEELFVIRWALE